MVFFANTNKPVPDKSINFNAFVVMRKYFANDIYTTLLSSMTLLGTGLFIINAGMALYMADLRQTSGEHYGYILA
jgi:hypothetical protein